MQLAKVLIVDDHALFRRGVRDTIDREEGLEVVGEAEDGREALARALELHPDLILLDISMPGWGGHEAVRAIKRELPETKIVILTVHEDDENLFEAIRGGADGFLHKNVRADALVDSIRGVVRGEAALSRRMAHRVLKEFARLAAAEVGNAYGQLTPREKQVLAKISEGLTNKEIAQSLVISENTVKAHVTSILNKLHLKNRSQAAEHARRFTSRGRSG